MTTVTHTFVSPKADSGVATKVQPSNWNAAHTVTVDIVDDTTPQLGGQLDTNGHAVSFDGATVTSVIGSGSDRGLLVTLPGSPSDGNTNVNPAIEFKLGTHDYASFQVSNTPSGDGGPYIQIFHDTVAPAAFQTTGGIDWFARNSAGTAVKFGGLDCNYFVATAGAETNFLSFATTTAGSRNTRVAFGDGVSIGAYPSVMPGHGNLGFAVSGASIKDVNANELIKFPATVASATNELTISNAANGSAPSIAATGSSDSNVNINLTPKGSGGVVVSAYIKSLSTTVGSLPSAATAGSGARAFVTDANSTTFLSVVATGGSNKVPVVSDGTNWLIG